MFNLSIEIIIANIAYVSEIKLQIWIETSKNVINNNITLSNLFVRECKTVDDSEVVFKKWLEHLQTII